MRVRMSEHADRQYETLDARLRRTVDKQLNFLSSDIRHPSLHAKKYDETTGLWQARITLDWRMYFLILRDVYYITSIRKHPKG